MKKKIALVTGGYSGEAVISYKTAHTIYQHIDRTLYDCFLIDIHPDGWFYKPDQGAPSPVDKNDFSINHLGEKIKFNAVLIALHGTPGEDGKLQGYLDCLNIPYTSCNTATSAITFNKKYTVAVAAASGIRVANSIQLFKNEPYNGNDIVQQLRLPVFVKPNNGGSSLGMSKVNDAAHIDAAIQKAFREDDQVLIESFVRGRELTIGVFRSAGEVITLPITEIVSKNEFFDFEAKYQGASEEITPARVDASIAGQVQEAAKKAYHVFNCSGVVRIDFIYEPEEGVPYMLEINTVPGQSDASIVPQQVRAMGWTLTRFYSELIESCLK
ncbi:MAG TPA: D-alanine--D-alanine ligase [Ferruginibacter sp.]|nr:D-alanine--D-alanine ligase [Ferruginibacter sp.]HRN80630.1 D-alanine--D-alanine ligase [Ferruginibacter sp.]HRO18404.1 D-alanine--D-alanine ligase [Ferruginibacter sp.]HRQ21629.1 D-alanine--D-alanine ligase [Ferruginibacter sp.]